jgi:hypothetical protein
VQDVIYLLAIVVFFVVAGLFVIGCDRIIGPDADALAEHGGTDDGKAAKIEPAKAESAVKP